MTVVGLCNEAMDYVGCSKVEYSKSTKSKHRNILLSMANYAVCSFNIASIFT